MKMRNMSRKAGPYKLEGCARCGDTHDPIYYSKFQEPVPIDGFTFTHWALCPNTGEPILMYIED